MTEPRANRRRGVTLIELLVVVAVMAILLGAILHMMQPVVKEMKVREAARMVNAFLRGAQARAKELGRPVAVQIEPYMRTDPNTNAGIPTGAAYQMFIAETPPPFAGDTTSAFATIAPGGSARSTALLDGSTMLHNYSDEQLVGGFIRFGYRGPFYEIRGLAHEDDDRFRVEFWTSHNTPQDGNSNSGLFKEPPAPGNVPYQVFPKPIKTSAAPLDIPEPLAIDIANSGIGPISRFVVNNANRRPIIISFAPNGSIHRIYGVLDTAPNRDVLQPVASVHLMVGWSDQLGAENETDYTTRWVSVSHLTGRIVTSENAGTENGTNPRQFAEDAMGMGTGT